MGDPTVQREVQEALENPSTESWDDAPNLDVCLIGFMDPVSDKDPIHKKRYPEPIDEDSRATEYLAKCLDLPFSVVSNAIINARGAVNTRNGELRRIAVKRIETGDRREKTIELIERIQELIVAKGGLRLPWEIIPLLLTLHGAMAARDQLGAVFTTTEGVSIRQYTEKMRFYERDPNPKGNNQWRLNPLWRAQRPLWEGPPITIRDMLDCVSADGHWFAAAEKLTGGIVKSCWDVGRTLQFPQNGRKMGLFWYFLAEQAGSDIAELLFIEKIDIRKGKKKKTPRTKKPKEAAAPEKAEAEKEEQPQTKE